MSSLVFQCRAVQEAAHLIMGKFTQSNAYVFPMRFALAVGQRVCFKDVPLTPPSLDIGVNDGSTATIIHHGKPRFTWGGDMPEESTYESMGLFMTPEFNVYENLVGLDVASTVPFPDNSFNTVCATEVFAYGLDRDRTLSELCRVLAPGGTLAFSESSEDILNFPALVDGLKQYVPTLNVLKDSRAYYRGKLAELGLIEITSRLYFDRSLAGLLLALMYSADPGADHDRHRRLLIEDQGLRRYYLDGLLAIASALDAEFSSLEEPQHGWHIFVSARKPGEQRLDLSCPMPICPTCRSSDLDSGLLHCRCRDCGHDYKMRYGIPYLLPNQAAAYSPKATRPPHLSGLIPLDHHIDRVLRASYPSFRHTSPPSFRFLGVDPTTAFTIRHLRLNGIDVLGVGTTVDRWVGREIERTKIQALHEVAQCREPLILSAYPGTEAQVLDALHPTQSAGPIYSIAQGTPERGAKVLSVSAPGEITEEPGGSAHWLDRLAARVPPTFQTVTRLLRRGG